MALEIYGERSYKNSISNAPFFDFLMDPDAGCNSLSEVCDA